LVVKACGLSGAAIMTAALVVSASLFACGSEAARETTSPVLPEEDDAAPPPATSKDDGFDAGTSVDASANVDAAAAPANLDLTGKWRGKAGGDSVFLDVTVAGADVSGNACESPTHDCYVLEGATFVDGRMTGSYSWPESGQTSTVKIDLVMSADGASLTGTYASSKCAPCALAATLTRWP